MQLTTDRLILRRWREEDYEPWADLNADPVVMEYFESPAEREQSVAWAKVINSRIDEHGFGWCAVEVKGGAPFIGFVGLNVPRDPSLPFMPAVETGWRLAQAHWGKGYATEAARASVDYGFTQLGLAEIVAYAVRANTRSLRVMERIGMTYDPSADFDYGGFPPGHPFRRHVLYRMSPPNR